MEMPGPGLMRERDLDALKSESPSPGENAEGAISDEDEPYGDGREGDEPYAEERDDVEPYTTGGVVKKEAVGTEFGLNPERIVEVADIVAGVVGGGGSSGATLSGEGVGMILKASLIFSARVM